MSSLGIFYFYKSEEYTVTVTPARVVRRDWGGGGAGNDQLCILFLRDVKSEKGERGS